MNNTPVYINGRFLGQRLTGIQRYARETLLALDQLLARDEEARRGIDVLLLVPRGTQVPPLHSIRTEEIGPGNGHLWEQLSLPWRVGRGLVLSFSATGPVFKRHQIVTVHDASVVRVADAFRPAFRRWYGFQIRRFGQRIRKVLTVSHFSAGELQTCFGVDPQRIAVTSEGWQQMLAVAPPPEAPRKVWSERPFVLAVSSPTPNKNFAAVAQAALDPRLSDVDFLIAGARDATVFEAATQTASPPNVKFLGYVSDADLCSLYDTAACFVFPSRYEGFGLPLIEAMSRGCPIVASDIPSTREVAGEAVLTFALARPDQMVEQIRRVVDDAQLAAELRQRGFQAAARYSWADAARLTWASVLEAVPAKPLQSVRSTSAVSSATP